MTSPAPKEQMRLNRFLSVCGISSRRKADELIGQGRVRVNDKIVKSLGVKVDPQHENRKYCMPGTKLLGLLC